MLRRDEIKKFFLRTGWNFFSPFIVSLIPDSILINVSIDPNFIGSLENHCRGLETTCVNPNVSRVQELSLVVLFLEFQMSYGVDLESKVSTSFILSYPNTLDGFSCVNEYFTV